MSEISSPLENSRPELVAVEHIHPALGALHWQNFLKKLSNGESEDRARVELFKRLCADSTESDVEVYKLPLLDTDIELAGAELKAYVRGQFEPQNSFLVKSGPRPDKQRLPEVANLEWDSGIQREVASLSEVDRLELKYTRLYYEVVQALHFAESDGESLQLQVVQDRLLVMKQETLSLRQLDISKSNNLTKVRDTYFQLYSELQTIKKQLDEYNK